MRKRQPKDVEKTTDKPLCVRYSEVVALREQMRAAQTKRIKTKPATSRSAGKVSQ
jgi:hypothetical protein